MGILKSTMHVEDWPLERIKPYAGNPRKRSKKAIEKVAASIREFGVRQCIVVDENGEILVGHTRRDAAVLLAMAMFPVHQAFGLTEAQKRAYRIADNRTNEETEWDEDLLAIEIKALEGFNLDLSLTGFDLRQVNSYLRGGPQEGEDEIPAEVEPRTKPGDLWVLGEHRLLCGDSTREHGAFDICDAMWTDPPYGVEYVGKTKRSLTIDNDTASSDVVERAIKQAQSMLRPASPFYIAHPPGARVFFFARVLGIHEWRIHQQLVWVKDSMVLGHSDYHFQHEPILYGFTPGEGRPGRGNHKGSKWFGGDDQVSVFAIPRPKRSEEHPTAKPVELVRRCVKNSTRTGDTIYDPFLGSGTTLVACETEGRRCYGLEIEPRYCDVIVARWEKLTGKTATLQPREVAA